MRKRIVGQRRIQIRSQSLKAGFTSHRSRRSKSTRNIPVSPSSPFSVGATSRGGGRSKEVNSQSRSYSTSYVHNRIRLRSVEPEVERTQEFTLIWSSTERGPRQEIVRQQWNFSPACPTSEIEDRRISLDRVSALEVAIKPDLAGESAPATLAERRIVELGDSGSWDRPSKPNLLRRPSLLIRMAIIR